MSEKSYADLHTHSSLSDGVLSPEELIRAAENAGIKALAITDHNFDNPDFEKLSSGYPQMELVRGSEISCLYTLESGRRKELHVVALDYDSSNEKIQNIFSMSSHGRKPYVEAILEKLRDNGIDLGTYEELKNAFPQTHHLGRKQIAVVMKERGYVRTVDEGFDIYIGALGKKKAYVEHTFAYAELGEVTEAIMEAGGIPVLAHLYSYGLTDKESRELVECYQKLTAGIGALEVEYARYTRAQRDSLRELAREYNLLESAASDFHESETVTLDNHFPYGIYQRMKERKKQYYG